MLWCADGHTNTDAALFCATCGAVMPPRAQAQAPPQISWCYDDERERERERDGAPSLEDEAFGADAGTVPSSPGPMRRRRRRSRRRFAPSRRVRRLD